MDEPTARRRAAGARLHRRQVRTLLQRSTSSASTTLSRSAWPLVFGSGLCALIYQMVWTRELRLVFGASTAASSSVVAIFVAGLGLGGLTLGARVERSSHPLRFYARLELAISVVSAFTPLLLHGVHAAYVWSGGSPRLGPFGSNALRLLLASCVLLPPTWLMGGTLPALARAMESDSDRGRRAVGFLYAVNTLGAVLGCALSTFVLLEAFGSRSTLYAACMLNGMVGLVAYALARRQPAVSSGAARVERTVSEPPQRAPMEASAEDGAAAPAWFVYSSAAVVGFGFFLMELVWYRVFGPLLGGSVFTFGLILCVALAGIGCGSALYAARRSTRPHVLTGFALSCAAEAVCLGLPYALGDRLAIAALFLQPFAQLGFAGLVFGWLAIALCAVFPAALISGYQFPLLIGLLGSGRTNVARDVGSAYAANTLGAVLGALAGGFGLLPLLGALGAWRATSHLLLAWSLAAVSVAIARRRRSAVSRRQLFGHGLVVALVAILGHVLLQADGPSAVLRHSPIGVGRVALTQFDGVNSIEAFSNQERRSVDWQADGIESAVAVTHYDGVSFVVNGKVDGSALTDAATQVMGGLVGAALLPRVRTALVIGLGTGSTAGWLASLPEIERVDVAEIEPVITQVARRCESVNQHAIHNPKLHIIRGDARELLAVLRTEYDVIFSEPSNPYRAGIASMYAQEFYAAVQHRLTPHGLFVQWLQAYDVDTSSIRAIYATLASVFPHVETWNGLKEDLLLVASSQPLVHDVSALRSRIAREPFVSAQRVAWYNAGLEGFLSHFVANEAFTRVVAAGAVLNTDDLSPVEFGFARSARGGASFSAGSLLASVQARGMERPQLTGEGVDWERVDYEREAFAAVMGAPTSPERLAPQYRSRLAALRKWSTGDLSGAIALFSLLSTRDSYDQLSPIERLARAELLAYEGSIESERVIEQLLRDRPTEGQALHAVYLLLHGQRQAGTELLVAALRRYRSDPWPYPVPLTRALNALQITAPSDAALAVRWLDALSQPFALRVNETARERARLRLAYGLGPAHPACVAVFEDFEPFAPWDERMLQLRAECYEKHAHPLREIAARELARFREHAPVELERLLSE